ncbi:MAG: site-specific DNA-methyltransferase [Clostridiales bacterium]|nr:site-specific DNA-methyltransferase [Clostridiales bacterium]
MQVYCSSERHGGIADGLCFLGRAEEILAELVAEYRGNVQLIYLDPPSPEKESLSLKLGHGQRLIKLPVAGDPWTEDNFLTLMRTVLTGCHALLNPTGALYLHTDDRMGAHLRLMCDEIFGKANFQNEIIWSRKTGGRSTRYFPRRHDTILYYRKGRKVFFDITAVGKPRGPHRTNHMKRFTDDDGRTGFSIRARGKLYKYYDDDLVYPSDVWTDIEPIKQTSRERVGWATQRPEALIKRLLLTSSREDDLVMDLFGGSGTTAAAAAAAKRRFVTADLSPLSLYTTRRRLLAQSSAPALGQKSFGELIFRYPAPSATAKIEAEIVKHQLVISEAKVGNGNQPLVYAATGYVAQDCFVACHTNCAPVLPIKIQLPENREAVVHLVNALGEQAFLTVEE